MKQEKIDIKNRTYDDHRNNVYMSFILHQVDEETYDNIAMLQDYLGRMGIEFDVTHYTPEDGNDGRPFDIMAINIDQEKFNTYATRKAGRKFDRNKEERYKPCTVIELNNMLATMKKSEIAEYLGCPRMTLHRIIKNLEGHNFDPESSIWYYTS